MELLLGAKAEPSAPSGFQGRGTPAELAKRQGQDRDVPVQPQSLFGSAFNLGLKS